MAFAWSARRPHYLPTVRQYAARVREFRLRYPWVREYSTWNEANHAAVQPTARNPRRTAVFYRALRRQCRAAGCRVVAVDVLGAGWRRTWPWLRAFRARAGRGQHIWGLHNYPDANRRRFASTARFLATIRRGEVWITETGGIVRFARRWRRNEYRAARAVRHAFRLTRAVPADQPDLPLQLAPQPPQPALGLRPPGRERQPAPRLLRAAGPAQPEPLRAAAAARSGGAAAGGGAGIEEGAGGFTGRALAGGPPGGPLHSATEDTARRRLSGRCATSGSARTLYWPEPCGRCRPSACTRRPAGTALRPARRPDARTSSSRAGCGRTR